ncbi:basic proline-rich protein-like isoform X1 [Hemicordylus capensis]|uniref:basic proline-rich protein-like isoform X1 n=1 Tax=Hemicordylus capensis TaxID=884348 RepID=UPI002304A386|nr:basic proline-rich protein-like isoform X1 [Hemicordylus capensis]
MRSEGEAGSTPLAQGSPASGVQKPLPLLLLAGCGRRLQDHPAPKWPFGTILGLPLGPGRLCGPSRRARSPPPSIPTSWPRSAPSSFHLSPLPQRPGFPWQGKPHPGIRPLPCRGCAPPPLHSRSHASLPPPLPPPSSQTGAAAEEPGRLWGPPAAPVAPPGAARWQARESSSPSCSMLWLHSGEPEVKQNSLACPPPQPPAPCPIPTCWAAGVEREEEQGNPTDAALCFLQACAAAGRLEESIRPRRGDQVNVPARSGGGVGLGAGWDSPQFCLPCHSLLLCDPGLPPFPPSLPPSFSHPGAEWALLVALLGAE